MFLLVFYFSVAVVVSFLCSLLESVILSVPYSHAQHVLQSGKRYGPLLKRLKYDISQPLSAILTLNTIANTLGAAGVGAQVHKLFGNGYVTLFSILLTFTILIVSEIIPKTIGASYWRGLLPFTVYLIRFLMVICYPFVQMSRLTKKLFGKTHAAITRDDVIGAAEVGVNEGSIYRNESELIKNILRLKNRKVLEIMTPRTVITAFEKNTTITDVIKKYQPIRFSRIPVYDGSLDQVIGLVHRYKIFEARSQDCGKVKVSSYLKPVHVIPETISVTAALDQFIKRKEHIFIVVDEYGTVSGLVTMEDVVETILGIEIVDELDSVADMRQQALNQWRLKKQKVGKPISS
ncbi:MAG: hemolysin family protein [Bdellovibrionales bacterium]|nr:hemolysin family protein [Bdellovibrionales bacterium]